MIPLTLLDVNSPEDLGLAIYEKVQELTGGNAHTSAKFLSAITCLELEGRDLPASTWSTLVLFSLSDLAINAPGVVLAVEEWPVHYNNISICSGYISAQQIASTLEWAGSVRQNIELDSSVPAGDMEFEPDVPRLPVGAGVA